MVVSPPNRDPTEKRMDVFGPVPDKMLGAAARTGKGTALISVGLTLHETLQ
jgi:hypothetical protein